MTEETTVDGKELARRRSVLGVALVAWGIGMVMGWVLAMLVANRLLSSLEEKRVGPTKLEQRVEGLRDNFEALANDVNALKKFKADCDVAVPFVSQKVDGLAQAHTKLVGELSQVFGQHTFDIAVLARALSDKFGKDEWAAMVDKAQRGVSEKEKPIVKPVDAKADTPKKPSK